MKLFTPPAHIIASDDLYGGTLRLFRGVNAAEGLSFDFVDTADVERVKSLINKDTKAIFAKRPPTR